MREQYWEMYTTMKYQFLCHKYFQITFNRINWILSTFFTITSLSFVAMWGLWGKYPLLWSRIICAAQFLQALFPKLPYNDLLISTRFMISAFDSILLRIEISWIQMNYVEDFSDDEIFALVIKYKHSYSELISQFFPAVYLPELSYLSGKAWSELERYFKVSDHTDKEVKHSNG